MEIVNKRYWKVKSFQLAQVGNYFNGAYTRCDGVDYYKTGSKGVWIFKKNNWWCRTGVRAHKFIRELSRYPKYAIEISKEEFELLRAYED